MFPFELLPCYRKSVPSDKFILVQFYVNTEMLLGWQALTSVALAFCIVASTSLVGDAIGHRCLNTTNAGCNCFQVMAENTRTGHPQRICPYTEILFDLILNCKKKTTHTPPNSKSMKNINFGFFIQKHNHLN